MSQNGMPNWAFKAITKDGKAVWGSCLLPTEKDVREQLLLQLPDKYKSIEWVRNAYEVSWAFRNKLDALRKEAGIKEPGNEYRRIHEEAKTLDTEAGKAIVALFENPDLALPPTK